MGEVFAGRYELLDPIATGGMGSIWRIIDRQDGAVKVAKILRQSDAASLLRFVREQSVRIDHTHVVTPLSWAGMDDRVLFTMPLVRGGSVADLVGSHGALPVRWVAVLTDQLLQALEAVHGAGIVHRDVKPGNLLLEPTGSGAPHLRLTDFGIAAPVDSPRMTRASVAIGTPGYMPPEQWYGADPDPRADLYSVGRVALEMLTGVRPSAAPAAADPPPAPHPDRHHEALRRLIAHATASDVGDRPHDATAMRRALTETGLLQLPGSSGEGVDVPDRFAGLPAAPRPTLPPPPPPPRAPGLPVLTERERTVPLSAATLAATPDTPSGVRSSVQAGAPATIAPSPSPSPSPATLRQGSLALGLVLITLGVFGLVIAALLVTGA